MRDTDGVLPNGWEMAIDIMLVVIVDEILFYYGHRLFHESKWLYIKVHKIHHEFQCVATTYCHAWLSAGFCRSCIFFSPS